MNNKVKFIVEITFPKWEKLNQHDFNYYEDSQLYDTFDSPEAVKKSITTWNKSITKMKREIAKKILLGLKDCVDNLESGEFDDSINTIVCDVTGFEELDDIEDFVNIKIKHNLKYDKGVEIWDDPNKYKMGNMNITHNNRPWMARCIEHNRLVCVECKKTNGLVMGYMQREKQNKVFHGGFIPKFKSEKTKRL